jgi:hypothetical protein
MVGQRPRFAGLSLCICEASVTTGPRFGTDRSLQPQVGTSLNDNVFAGLQGLGCASLIEPSSSPAQASADDAEDRAQRQIKVFADNILRGKPEINQRLMTDSQAMNIIILEEAFSL